MLWIHVNTYKPHTSKDISWLLRHRWGKSSQTSRFGRMPPVDLKAGSIRSNGAVGFARLDSEIRVPRGCGTIQRCHWSHGHLSHRDFAGQPPFASFRIMCSGPLQSTCHSNGLNRFSHSCLKFADEWPRKPGRCWHHSLCKTRKMLLAAFRLYHLYHLYFSQVRSEPKVRVLSGILVADGPSNQAA